MSLSRKKIALSKERFTVTPKRILDISCGLRHIALLNSHGAKVFGIDISPIAVNCCNQLHNLSNRLPKLIVFAEALGLLSVKLFKEWVVLVLIADRLRFGKGF